MNEKTGTYQIVDLSAERRGMAAFQEIKVGRHNMYALLEVDVTTPKKFIDEYKTATGKSLSFTGYLITCLARAVAEDKAVQAYRKGSKKLVMFNDVDVGFMIELKQGEKRILRGHVIRGANRKTYREINEEIRAVQESQATSGDKEASWFRSALLLPWPLSNLFKFVFRMMLKNSLLAV
jgi:pyruvate/2-oxoglutarate dehydrogenase complex dihydrolipoamide acyltransferase (E2) component